MGRTHVIVSTGVILAATILWSPSSGARASTQGPHHLIAASYAVPGSTAVAQGAPNDPSAASSDRTTVDQPDGTGDHQTHLIYFVPKGTFDRALDTDGTIAMSFRGIRAWFVRETGSLRPRVDTTGTGSYDISFVAGRSESSAYTTMDAVVADIQSAGFAQASKRYMIYAEINRGDTCGEGYYPLPPLRDQGQYAVVYLGSNAGCGSRDFGGGSAGTAGKAETIAAHEWLHNEGIAPIGAPHYCASHNYHVCTGPLWASPALDPEATDIVFPYIMGKLSTTHLDLGRDDYFDHGWPWLANLRDSSWLEAA